MDWNQNPLQKNTDIKNSKMVLDLLQKQRSKTKNK